MRKMFHHALSLFLALTVLNLSLTGCGGGSKDVFTSTTSARNYMAETMTETMAAAAPAMAADIGGYEMEKGAYYEEMPMAAETSDSGSGGVLTGTAGLDGSSTAAQQAPARKLIRTVRLSIETDDFDNLLDSLQKQVAALGGYVEQSDISGVSLTYRNQPNSRYASITVRIPSNQLNQFVQAAEESGNVTFKSESTEDVTLRYSDLESRKKSLTIEQERIWELLEKADTLEAVISLEERLSEIRYELESMESQLRLYDNQVDYSTIYIDINEVVDFTPVAPETTGQQIKREFLINLRSVGNALTNLLIFLITTAPIWFLLLLVLAVIVIIAKKRPKKQKPQKQVFKKLQHFDDSPEARENQDAAKTQSAETAETDSQTAADTPSEP